jgi:hypothetical protein
MALCKNITFSFTSSVRFSPELRSPPLNTIWNKEPTPTFTPVISGASLKPFFHQPSPSSGGKSPILQQPCLAARCPRTQNQAAASSATSLTLMSTNESLLPPPTFTPTAQASYAFEQWSEERLFALIAEMQPQFSTPCLPR